MSHGKEAGLDAVGLRGRERLLEVIGPTVNEDYPTVTKVAIQPGNLLHNPWLSAMASRYETYEYTHLEYVYIPKCGTDVHGDVIMAVDYDALNETPRTRQQIETFRTMVAGAPWSETRLLVPLAELLLRKHRYLRTIEPNQGDLKTYDLGNFYLALTSDANSTGLDWGTVYVHYRVLLESPYMGNIGSYTRVLGFEWERVPGLYTDESQPAKIFRGDLWTPETNPSPLVGRYKSVGVHPTFNGNDVTLQVSQPGEYSVLLTFDYVTQLITTGGTFWRAIGSQVNFAGGSYVSGVFDPSAGHYNDEDNATPNGSNAFVQHKPVSIFDRSSLNSSHPYGGQAVYAHTFSAYFAFTVVGNDEMTVVINLGLTPLASSPTLGGGNLSPATPFIVTPGAYPEGEFSITRASIRLTSSPPGFNDGFSVPTPSVKRFKPVPQIGPVGFIPTAKPTPLASSSSSSFEMIPDEPKPQSCSIRDRDALIGMLLQELQDR